jgi:hypothetical protein
MSRRPAGGSVVAMTVDLHWIPLGAGGRSVAFNGRVFEALAAARAHRRRRALYHAALVVESGGARYAIELAPDRGVPGDGVVATGPVGTRCAGRLRLFRYGLRCAPGGTIPDLAYAVGGPLRLSGDPAVAARIVALAPQAPRLTWGRDEAGTGEMWNSNSVVAWLLASAGLPAAELSPPAGGRAPGWGAGVDVARRRTAPALGGEARNRPRLARWGGFSAS